MPRPRKIRIAVLLLLSIAGPLPAFGQDTRTVHLVEITSKPAPSYLGRPKTNISYRPTGATRDFSALRIVKEGDDYKLNGETVDPQLIAGLVRALTAPSNAAPNLDDLGVTPAWLKEHAASAAKTVSESMMVGAKHVPADALEKLFADPAVMNPIVPTLFRRRNGLCFDCSRGSPEVQVAICLHPTFSGVCLSLPR